MTKLLENTYRAVNIALVNELAVLRHEMGIDIWEVIAGAATKPFGFQSFRPGIGPGGHCIPVDPYYLSWRARAFDFQTKFIELAADTNLRMAFHVRSRILSHLNQLGSPLAGARSSPRRVVQGGRVRCPELTRAAGDGTARGRRGDGAVQRSVRDLGGARRQGAQVRRRHAGPARRRRPRRRPRRPRQLAGRDPAVVRDTRVRRRERPGSALTTGAPAAVITSGVLRFTDTVTNRRSTIYGLYAAGSAARFDDVTIVPE